MTKIQELFDQDIHRRIEKVIQYQTTDHELLRQEIAEYVATDAIQLNLERLLDLIDDAMSSPSNNEVGVWVSGFYGSGKSSFTKYLGYALDSQFTVGGKLFREFLKNRLPSIQLQQRLETVAARHNPVVIMVDLSVNSFAQSQDLPVSTVLFLHVLQWAGYSRELKLAYLEILAEEAGRLDELKETSDKLGRKWDEIHHNAIIGNAIGGQIALKMFPDIFPTEQSFQAIRITEAVPEHEQLERMLELIKKRTGRDKVIFVVDEVGLYVASSDLLVRNLQGFAQNLKDIGKGRAWILATAQQTLTDDVGAINSQKLFKLKDRFPVSTELRADDIKVITHTRLLSKKTPAKAELEKLFLAHGAKLNVLTRLEGVRGYTTEVEIKQFIDLYPFLPQHFDLMMNIIARLARSTGGTGLRSAIKVVQETLVAGGAVHSLSSKSIGALVTVVDFYDVLRQDLESSPLIRHTVESVRKTEVCFGASSLELAVAKVVAVTQILDDFPLTRRNLAALLVGKVDAEDDQKKVSEAVDALLNEKSVPLEEVDGRLRFLSEQAAGLATTWRNHQPTSADQRQVLADAIKESLLPDPVAATIFENKRVRAGVTLEFADYSTMIEAGPDGIVVTFKLVDQSEFDTERSEALNRSTSPSAEKSITAIAAVPSNLTDDIRDAYASAKMIRELRARPLSGDEDAFFRSLSDRLKNAKMRIADGLAIAAENGTVIFRGEDLPVKTAAPKFGAALSNALGKVARHVYEKYEHAVVVVPVASAAEKILKTKDPSSITSADDPLNLLEGGAGGVFNQAHPAVVDILDYIGQRGSVDGKQFLDELSKAPYGWNKDVSRYIVAAMFAGGHLSLRVDAHAVTTATSAVIEAFKNNVTFARVGIDAPPAPPPMEVLKRAKDLLVELTGQSITPLPKIVEGTARELIDEMLVLAGEVTAAAAQLGLGVREQATTVSSELRNLSDAEQNNLIRAFGDEQGTLGGRLSTLKEQHVLLTGPFASVLFDGREILGCYDTLPDIGEWSEVQSHSNEARETLHALYSDPDISGCRMKIQERVSEIEDSLNDAVDTEWNRIVDQYQSDVQKLRNSVDWGDLTAESREKAGEKIDHLEILTAADAPGTDLRADLRVTELRNRQYTCTSLLDEVRHYVEMQAKANRETKRTSNETTYVIVPTGDMEVREAETEIVKMLDTVKGSPAEARVRFRLKE
jgi:hypothetical protein